MCSCVPLQVDLATALELIAAKRARDAARAAKGLLPRGGRRGKAAAAAGAAGKKEKEAKAGAGAGAGGYVEFARVRWAEMKAEDPDASYREAVKVISAEWRGMGEEQRRAFAAGAGAGAEAGGSESEGDGEQVSGVAPGSVEQVAAVVAKGRKKAAAVTVKKGAAAKVAVGAGSKGSSSKSGSSSSGGGGGAGRSNPYMAFCREQREAIRAAHPGSDMAEQGRLLGAAWRALSEEERASYR